MFVNCSLALEGGGLRGIYSSGVLDYFMEQNLDFSDVIGSSAGACNGCRYVSHDHGAMHYIDTELVFDPRYKGLKYFLDGKGFINMDFLFDTIPDELAPFRYDDYFANPATFYSTVTNALTGECEYLEKNDFQDSIAVRASSTLPLIAPVVNIHDTPYFDGGIADPIPFEKCLTLKDRCVVVLTRPEGYQKMPEKTVPLLKLTHKKYPGLIHAMEQRHLVYNSQLKKIEELQKEGKVFVIRPTGPVDIGRISAEKSELEALYQMGYNDAKQSFESLMEFLKECKE